MAKIDTTKIEGFDGMDAEALRKLIADMEIPEDKSAEFKKLQDTYQKAKASFDKTASELNALKDKAKEQMSADEQAKAEMEELTKKYEELLKENTKSKHTASLTALGFDSELAAVCAAAICDGDADTLFESLNKFKTGMEKSIKADLVKGTPKPTDNGSGKTYKSREEIMNIKNTAERQAAIADNPELFGIQ